MASWFVENAIRCPVYMTDYGAYFYDANPYQQNSPLRFQHYFPHVFSPMNDSLRYLQQPRHVFCATARHHQEQHTQSLLLHETRFHVALNMGNRPLVVTGPAVSQGHSMNSNPGRRVFKTHNNEIPSNISNTACRSEHLVS